MSEMAKRILGGDIRAISRAISMVERGDAGAAAVLREIYPRCGRGRTIGITGSPGAGKSSMINELAQAYLRGGHRVAVLAVDPTSEFTGGGVLGDRVRMPIMSDGLYIRSLGTRGHLGGLNRSCGSILPILDAAGYDRLIIETVGIGQSEIEIQDYADMVAVVTTPNQGDDIQALKAGILEIGDLFVVNKADLPNAERTVADLEQMIYLYRDSYRKAACGCPNGGHCDSCAERECALRPGAPRSDGEWVPRVMRVVASRGEGVAELMAALEEYLGQACGSGELSRRRLRGQKRRMMNELTERWRREAAAKLCAGELWESVCRQVADAAMDPWSGGDILWNELTTK